MEKPDDAGVYLLAPGLALVQSVDFFTPIVDDPATFGAIAAANALSDIYAMGGKPLTALSIACFPGEETPEVLGAIIRGGADKLAEAGVALLGGHTVKDSEIKFGYAVTGTVAPERVLTKSSALPGDRLILTKPLGGGILATAIKKQLATPEMIETLTRSMLTLNRTAAQVMEVFEVHACTDITGFGLLGHGLEMARNSGVALTFDPGRIPVFPGTLEMLAKGCKPGGILANRSFVRDHTAGWERLLPGWAEILCDPQTSGGLLIAVAGPEAEALLAALHQAGIPEAVLMGEVDRRIGGPSVLLKSSF